MVLANLIGGRRTVVGVRTSAVVTIGSMEAWEVLIYLSRETFDGLTIGLSVASLLKAQLH